MNSNLLKILKKPFVIVTICLISIISISVTTYLTRQKKNLLNQFFSLSVLTPPKNLDPQTANSSQELTIVNNIFEGLYRRNKQDKFELGMAENVETDENKKTKTFTIKKNIHWKTTSTKNESFGKTEITAEDFLFAFQRLLNPKTNAPLASNYYFLKNAKKVNKGNLPPNKLGVKLNEKKQLVLEMEYFPPNLEELLTCACTAPCNEKFFNSTKGRYGTDKDMLIYNGPFYIHSWQDNEELKKIRLRANKLYEDAKNVKPLGINISIRAQDEAIKMFKKKDIDLIFIDHNQFKSLNINPKNSQAFQNNVIGLIFNENNEIFKNKNLRKALAFDVDSEKLEDNSDDGLIPINGLIPNSVTINNVPYRDLIESTARPQYNPKAAKDYLTNAFPKLKNPPNLNEISILVNEPDYSALNTILQTWQKDLGIFLKLDVQPPEAFTKKLFSENFTAALVTLSNDFNSPSCILSKFSSNSQPNYLNIDIKDYDKILSEAQIQENPKTAAAKYLEIEKLICEDGHFIPIYQQTKHLVWNKKIKNLLLSQSDEQLYFKFATK